MAVEALEGRIAVVTGGASGLGLAFARRFLTAGMSVAIADIEPAALAEAAAGLGGAPAGVLAVHCDVSDPESMAALGDEVVGALGQPHLVCLNAGVGAGSQIAQASLADWQWVLGVNLWGVVHGLTTFLPGMLAADEGHVVITSSVAGHTSYPGLGPYNASKHAVAAIAETLHHELAAEGSAVGVTCLCPGIVATNILTSSRNRPEALTDHPAEPASAEEEARRAALVEWMAATGHSPDAVAELVHDAVLDGTFWLFTDDDYGEPIARRHAEIAARWNPVVEASLFDR